MWTEALSLLEQADRLHRQFLRAAGAEQPHAWEPPADVIETGDEHRIEIPYGRFERRLQLPLDDPYAALELARKTLADGVLTLIFRRKEGR